MGNKMIKEKSVSFLENKIKKLEKNFISEFVYINGLTHITDENCIREYTDIMIKKLKKRYKLK